MQARKIKEDNVISIAEVDDTDEIMKFIGNEWEKGHILGFLKASSEKDSTVWTTMWKVSKDNGTPMLGVNLLNFLREQGYCQ